MTADMLWIQAPAGYTDSLTERAALTAAIARTHPRWQIQAILDGRIVAVPAAALVPRPYPVIEELAAGVSAAKAAEFDARHQRDGRTLVEWCPEARRAVAAYVAPAVKALRELVASALGVKPWDVDVTATWQEGHLAEVRVGRVPPRVDASKRHELWRQLIAGSLDAGNHAWIINDDPLTRTATLTWRPPLRLPALVRFEGLLPEQVVPDAWSRLPFGMDAHSAEVAIDFKAGPHALVVGGTGSGKSTALRLIMLQALTRGFEMVLVDPVKRAAGLRDFEPYAKRVVTTNVEEAAAALEVVYAEVRRRVDAIYDARVEDWQGLPKGSVHPWLVILDEFSSLVQADPKPVVSDPQDQVLLAWQDETSAKAKVVALVGRIAREARSAGIFLVISTQRPDTAQVPGQVREQLGTIVQLIVPTRAPSPEAIRMVPIGDGRGGRGADPAVERRPIARVRPVVHRRRGGEGLPGREGRPGGRR